MKLSSILTAILLLLKLSSPVGAQQSQQVSVSKETIKIDYKKHSEASSHPRLFASKDDIQQLKALLEKKDPFVVNAYAAIKKESDKLLNEPLLQYQLDEAKLRIPTIHQFATQLPPLLLSYWISGEKSYAYRIWQQLELMAQYPDWGQNRHFLDTGIACFNFAWAYDGLYDYLTSDQRKVIKEALIKHAITPGSEQMFKNQWWHTIQNNWNGICNSGMIEASLVLFDENPDLFASVIAKAVEQLPRYLHDFDPDGQCVEGLLYWGYGLSYTFLGMEAMHRMLGSDYGLSQIEGFRKTAYFPIFSTGPIAGLNVGDDAINQSVPQTFFWFAKQLNNISLARYQYDLCFRNKSFRWLDLLFYPPQLLQSKSEKRLQLPLDNYIHVSDLLSFRENMESTDAMFVALFGGDNNASHGHLDAGSFYIQGLGEYWAYGNLGRDNYTFEGYFSKVTKPDYFEANDTQKSPGRWHFYRLRAEGKNCIVINPDTRPDQNPFGVAKTVKFESKPQGGFGIIDLTDCYKRDVRLYQRGIMLGNNRKVITIQDEIATKTASTVYWLMNTKAEITLTEDGKSAILKQNGKQLTARILSPEEASFTSLQDGYLPEQHFPLTINSPNNGFRKLAIHLDKVKQTTITIEFYPTEQEEFSENKKITSLSKWKIK